MKKNELAALLAMLNDDQDTDIGQLLTRDVALTNQATMLTQPGGIFATYGLEPDVISTHVRPMGLGAYLPAPIPASSDDPRYPVFAGYGAETGTNPDYPCEDAPSGVMQAGQFTAYWGRIPKQTKTIEIDKLLHSGGRGVTTNLRLLGQIFGDSPISANMTQDQILDLVVKAEMVGALVQMERTLSRMLWTGDASNNTAHGGYKEFLGLDNQITTGRVDADGGGALPNLDSYISNFGYAEVSSGTPDIVAEISYALYYLETLAENTGMAPIQFALAMRSELFHELCEIYPVRYMSQNSYDKGGNQLLVVNDNNAVRVRDAMKAGKYIEAYGKRYPVIVDDGIYEQNSTNSANVPAGRYASHIYILPMTYAGANQGVYMEHIDYRGVSRQISPMGQGAQKLDFWTDDGRFLWNLEQIRFCFNMQVKVEPRVILRVPQLAGKIMNVRYTPRRKMRDAFPDSPYYVSGGVKGSAADVLAQLIDEDGDYGRRF